MSPDRPGYDDLLDTLESELAVVADGFDGLTPQHWASATTLRPPSPDGPAWTVFELAGHLDISIGITSMLLADVEPGDPERDAADFFVFGAGVPSEFYDYAYTMVEDRSPATMAGVLRTTFAHTLAQARATAPGTVGRFPGCEPYPLIRLDDFMATRVVEAVVHGIDLTDALGLPSTATRSGLSHTARILDDLHARGTRAGRPPGLEDDAAWVRAASGRSSHPDPRLPLLT
jgi:uncharacterized protein (TIGR03083 family)